MAMKRTTVPVAVGTGRLVTSPRKIREAALAEADQDEPTGGLVIDQRGEVLSTASFLSRDPNQYVADIHNLWHRAQESFIAIGQRLVAVREIIEERLRTDPSFAGLPLGQRRSRTESEWRAFLDKLPKTLTQPIASQLECIARALSSGRLQREELPGHYSVAYQLTTLSDAELAAARREPGVIGAKATRARIIEFKQRLRQARLDARARIERRRQKILVDLQRLKEELTFLDQQLVAIEVGDTPVVQGNGRLSINNSEAPETAES